MSEDDSNRDQPASAEKVDVALIHGRTEDGEGLKVIRRRDDRIELAHVRPLKEGRPIDGEVVRMSPRPEFPLLCDVKTELAAPTRARAVERRGGPPQVASDTYRRNWDAIFLRDDAPSEPDLLN